MRRNPAALPPPKCAPARYLPLDKTTAARIPAVLPPPSQDAPASAAGEGRGGGSASDSGTNTTSPATPAIYIHLSARCVCKSPNSPLPRGGGLGWGQQKKPHSDNTHTTTPLTYTFPVILYVRPAIACALAHRFLPDKATAARIPANRLSSPCVGGTGGGVSRHTANAESSAALPPPPWGRVGVGAAKKPHSDNTHSTTPFTYTLSAQVYINRPAKPHKPEPP